MLLRWSVPHPTATPKTLPAHSPLMSQALSLTHYPDTSYLSGRDCLEAWGLLWFWAWGVECGADDDTSPPTTTLPSPPLQGASSSCLVVVRFSVLCRITWGGDNPALVGSGAGWDRQGLRGKEMYTRCWKGEEKETDRQKSERKKGKKQRSCRKLIHSAKSSSLFCLIPQQPSDSSALSNPLSFSLSLCHSLCPPAMGLCRLQRC